MRIRPLPLALLAVAALNSLACGTSDTTVQPGGAGSQNVSDDGGTTSDEEIALPLVVDFNFFPSGAFGRLIDTGPDGVEDDFADGCDGDDHGEWDNVAIDQTESACPERPAQVTADSLLSLSRCTAFAFTPEGLDSVDQTTWGGVVFQNTTCNWGGQAGSPIAAGASTLSFWAWSTTENVGTSIVFQAGGVGDTGTPHRDSFKRLLSVDLSDTPTQYEIDLSTTNYATGVLSAFGWTAERSDLSPLTFYVDGMTWQ